MSKLIDIIIPCYNENNNIVKTIHEIESHIKNLEYDFRFLLVDDGSTDNTYETIVSLTEQKKNINVIKLSRNFGKESAIFAGLQICNADAAVILDADLQHPPGLIQMLIREWENGADVVDAVKKGRGKENRIKRFFAIKFYKIMNILTDMDFDGSSDYKLIDKKIIYSLKTIDEKNRFFRGLVNWVGFKHHKVEFTVENKNNRDSKFTLIKLMQLSIDAITSHSSKLLHIITFLGILTFIFSFVLGFQTLYNYAFGNAVSGFTTVILLVLLLSSIIMISIGIIGLYVSKIYDEVKKRPIYIVDKYKIVDLDETSSNFFSSRNAISLPSRK